jgi:hypothetical protein
MPAAASNIAPVRRLIMPLRLLFSGMDGDTSLPLCQPPIDMQKYRLAYL